MSKKLYSKQSVPFFADKKEQEIFLEKIGKTLEFLTPYAEKSLMQLTIIETETVILYRQLSRLVNFLEIDKGEEK
jgi:hypothetical protein